MLDGIVLQQLPIDVSGQLSPELEQRGCRADITHIWPGRIARWNDGYALDDWYRDFEHISQAPQNFL
ncbi:MAG: hypothetical protein NVS4B8_03890 [Herpetosiphon sp.]